MGKKPVVRGHGCVSHSCQPSKYSQAFNLLSVRRARSCKWSVVLQMCCVSSVLCPWLGPEGQLIPLQLGQPKIIRQPNCWQEVSTCCFVMINPASGASLGEAVGAQQLLGCDKKPFPAGWLVLLSEGAAICGSQPGGLGWDSDKASSGSRQHPAVG